VKLASRLHAQLGYVGGSRVNDDTGVNSGGVAVLGSTDIQRNIQRGMMNDAMNEAMNVAEEPMARRILHNNAAANVPHIAGAVHRLLSSALGLRGKRPTWVVVVTWLVALL